MPSLRSLVVLVLLLSVALVGIRLYSAPFDSAWLGRLAASRLADRLGTGWDVRVDAVRLDFTEGFMPTISALDTELDAAEKGLLVSLPLVTGTPTATILYSGEPGLGLIRVDRPIVVIDRSKASTPLLSGAEFAHMADAGVSAALKGLAGLDVDEIVVSDATLALDGPVPRTFEAIDLSATVDEETGKLRVRASVAGRDGRWGVEFKHGEDDKVAGGRWLQLKASDVTISEFLPEAASVQPGRGLGLPLYPQLTLRLDAEGVFSRGDLRLGVGGGYVSLKNDGSVLIDEILMHLSWSAGQQHVVLEPSYAVFGDTRIALHGEITPPQEAGSAQWGFAIESPQAWVRPRDVPGAPLVLDRALAFGSFDAAKMLLNLDTLSLRAGTASVAGAGSIEFKPDGPYMALAMSFGTASVATVKRLWPSLISPKARKWFIEHISNGRFHGGRLIVGLDPLGFDGDPSTVGWTEEGLQLDFGFEGLTVKGVGDLPPLTGASGTGAIHEGRFYVDANGASAVVPAGGTLKVAKGHFEIPDLRPADKTGELELTLSGGISDIGRIAALRPVDAMGKLGIDPEALSGKGDVEVSVAFPLKRRFDKKAALWGVTATFADFSSSQPIVGQSIKSANLNVTANPTAATIRGRGLLNGLPADIDLVQPLDGSGIGGSQGVVLDIDTKELVAKGIDLGDLITGRLRVGVRSRDDGRRDVDVDLEQAKVVIAPVGWTKSAGVPATARFIVAEKDGAQIVDDFSLTSEGVSIEGALRLGKGGQLETANFTQFGLRDTDRGKLTINRTKSGGYTVDFDAERFDGRGFLSSLKRGSDIDSGKAGKDIELTAKIARMTGFKGVEITSLVAGVSSKDGVVRKADISGLSNGRASVRARIIPKGEQRALVAEMANAGEVLSFLGLYDRMRGGAGTLNANLPDDTSAVGRLLITDLTIAEDSELKKILAANPQLQSRERNNDRSNKLQRFVRSNGTSFQKLSVDFSKVGDRVTVSEGTLKGPVLGGTLSGTVDLAPPRLDLTGTFVPVYALNNLFGQIPLLGQLAGGRNGGLLGVTFRVSGTLEKPVLSVNPMSAIAPGIFRKIFEFR